MFDSSLIKKIGVFLFTAALTCALTRGQDQADNSMPGCANYLYINGESNVNQFTFRYISAGPADKSRSFAGDTGSVVLSIPIKDFEASNPMMYNDFLELMKEQRYPKIIVSFSKQQLAKSLADRSLPCPDVHITIAGITRVYKIQCSVVTCSQNLYLKGEETIKLTDFHLKPPSKLLGLVKVNNEINVNFGFIITFTNNNRLAATL